MGWDGSGVKVTESKKGRGVRGGQGKNLSRPASSSSSSSSSSSELEEDCSAGVEGAGWWCVGAALTPLFGA